MNFVYSVDEKPAEGLVTVLNELLAASLSHGDKVTLYELFLQYSATICTDLQDLLRLKADYAVWKLAARAEQEAKEEERGSVKREAPAPAPVMAPVQQGDVASYPAIPGTVPGTMPSDADDANDAGAKCRPTRTVQSMRSTTTSTISTTGIHRVRCLLLHNELFVGRTVCAFVPMIRES